MGFSEDIRKARKKAGLTQKELAQKTGLSPMSISNYETEKRKPTVDTFFLIMRALDQQPVLEERSLRRPNGLSEVKKATKAVWCKDCKWIIDAADGLVCGNPLSDWIADYPPAHCSCEYCAERDEDVKLWQRNGG